MRTTLALLVCGLCLTSPLFPQDRASMEAPVIKTSPGTVVLMARISAFTAGEDYRLGLGVASGDLASARVELIRDGNTLSLDLASFKQGFTSSWWSVDELSAKGFYLSGSDIPTGAGTISLKVEIPKADADKLGKVYVFVAKKYGGSVWYLEDGAELTSQDW